MTHEQRKALKSELGAGQGEQPTYQQRIVAAIRARLFARWPPRSDAEREQLELNARFFAEQCTYDEADADGRSDEEVADDELDAAM